MIHGSIYAAVAGKNISTVTTVPDNSSIQKKFVEPLARQEAPLLPSTGSESGLVVELVETQPANKLALEGAVPLQPPKL